jgi:hypothetical protein
MGLDTLAPIELGDLAFEFESTVSSEVVQEINSIVEAKPNKCVTPEDVLSAAHDKKSALHKHFEWDDTSAAHKHRLNQARMLIVQSRLVVISGEKRFKVRAFVSLASDRIGGEGYRSLPAVLSKAEQRQELLRTALKEFTVLREKYRNLSELAGVFTALDGIAI